MSTHTNFDSKEEILDQNHSLNYFQESDQEENDKERFFSFLDFKSEDELSNFEFE